MSSSSAVQRRSTLVLEAGGHSGNQNTCAVRPLADPGIQKDQTRRLRVTPWRLINSVFLSAVGIWKVDCAYRGDPTANALDFAGGAVWALISYWFSLIETEAPEKFPLLFDHDVVHIAFALYVGICITAGSSCCIFLVFFISDKLQNNLDIPNTLILKIVVEIVILVGIFLLIWAIFKSAGVRLHDSAIISAASWDSSTRWLGYPAFFLLFILSLASSTAIVLSTPMIALTMELFAIKNEELAFTVVQFSMTILIYTGMYLIVGFGHMITRAVSKKID